MAQQPMYQQIADAIRRQIEDGELERGQQLPTELELREKFGASRNTVRDAIKRLSALNLVESKPGRGTFVTLKVEPFVITMSADPEAGFGGEGSMYVDQVSAAHRVSRSSQPQVEMQVPPEEVRLRLRLSEGSQTVLRHQQRFIDEIPWSLEASYYPMEFITRGATRLLLANKIEHGAVEYLDQVLGIRQVSYRDWITARQPDEYEQRFFGTAHDTAVFVLYRTAFDQHKEPMRVMVSTFPADRNQFIYDVGKDLPAPRYADEILRNDD
jgi:GntR family transcriptional regulator